MSHPSPELEDELSAFAQTTQGRFEDRMAAVMDKAFAIDGTILGATKLKEICGGGSMATANKVVQAFRAKLHERAGFSLDLGSHVPKDIAENFAQALTAVWADMRRRAESAWDESRLDLTRKLEAATARADGAVALADARSETIATLEDRVSSLSQNRDALQAMLAERDTTVATLGERVDALVAAEIKSAAQVADLLAQASAREQTYRSHVETVALERNALISSHKDELTKLTHRLGLEKDAVETLQKAAVKKATNLEAENTRLTSARAAAEASLAAAETTARTAEGRLTALDAEVRTLSGALGESRTEIASLTTQIQASKVQEVDMLALLSWIHALDPGSAGDAPPWDVSTPQGRLAMAVLSPIRALQKQLQAAGATSKANKKATS